MSDDTLDAAMRERGAILGLCYRMLGSLSDAEDAVQETYVRWWRLPEEERAAIVSPKAWLMKTASRVSLDALGSARARRERYVGEWLPEPVTSDALWSSHDRPMDPSDRVSLDESVSMALMIVLESMTPAQRVAFVLHDVFRYTFDEVAEVLGRSPEASRQLASSARRSIERARRQPVDAERRAAVIRSVKAALESGDIPALLGLLDPDAVAIGDGGGLATAAPRPVHGADRIVKLLQAGGAIGRAITVEEDEVNGEPGLVMRQDGRAVAVMTFSFNQEGRIDRVWGMRNPEKLTSWNHP